MARRIINNHICPICGNPVTQTPDAILKKSPHYNNCEYVVTKRGLKQYIHSSCWTEMIGEKRPYDCKMYV